MARLEHSVEYFVEKAFKDLLKVVFKGYKEKVALNSFVAMDDSKKMPEVSYPAISFIANPYLEFQEGSGFGSVELSLMVRSHVNDDPLGRVCDEVYASAAANIDKEAVASYQNESIEIEGITRIRQTTASIDFDTDTREKSITYTVYLKSLQKS